MKFLAIAIAAIALGFNAYAEDKPKNQGNDKSAQVKQGTKNAALTAKVKTALATDVGLKTLKIDVDSNGNTVTLKGVVDSAETKRRVGEVAKKVEGVASVKNELKVRGG
jgi:osmotically-inducible protein OsmY